MGSNCAARPSLYFMNIAIPYVHMVKPKVLIINPLLSIIKKQTDFLVSNVFVFGSGSIVSVTIHSKWVLINQGSDALVIYLDRDLFSTCTENAFFWHQYCMYDVISVQNNLF